MISLIQCRTNQIRHTGIENGKFLISSLFYIKHTGNQRTALPRYGTPQFKMERLIGTQFQVLGIGIKIIFEVRYRLAVRMLIINPQSATYIDVLDADAMRFQFILQFVHTVAKSHEIAHIQYLRTNVEVQSDELYVLHLQRHIYHIVHVLHTDAELVLRQSGSDIGMGMCPHIGVDAESYIRNLTLCRSQFIDDFQFGDGLYIETENIIIQAEVDFPICLAHSGKHYLIRRETCLDCCTNFTATYTVGPQSVLTDDGKHFRIGICLHGIVHVKVAMLCSFGAHTRKGFTQHLRVIVIKRGAQLTEFIYGECSFHILYLNIVYSLFS